METDGASSKRDQQGDEDDGDGNGDEETTMTTTTTTKPQRQWPRWREGGRGRPQLSLNHQPRLPTPPSVHIRTLLSIYPLGKPCGLSQVVVEAHKPAHQRYHDPRPFSFDLVLRYNVPTPRRYLGTGAVEPGSVG